ncbi:helix-turn-helix domain-containing protein [Streptomyces hygroscopicus]|uniref:helix-turn-helix domain-containing protein n=1 Tax=Streptomyces hygroscopicus TaxID=1912 RepID=UPI00099DD369|nr:helix-turn-helix transcriptional regulator [Streptomyces hygroscopicus]
MTFEPERLGQSRSDLAEALRGQRKRAGKTQTWLARHCTMSQTKVSNLETGRITQIQTAGAAPPETPSRSREGIPHAGRVQYGGMRAGPAGNSSGPCRVARGRGSGVPSGLIRLRATVRS